LTRYSPPIRHRIKGRDGDRSNAVLAAAGYNFALLLRWLARLLLSVKEPNRELLRENDGPSKEVNEDWPELRELVPV
jgi:hypothetical protein